MSSGASQNPPGLQSFFNEYLSVCSRTRAICSCHSRAESDGSTQWSTRKLAQALDISHMMIARVWRKHALKPDRVEGAWRGVCCRCRRCLRPGGRNDSVCGCRGYRPRKIAAPAHCDRGPARTRYEQKGFARLNNAVKQAHQTLPPQSAKCDAENFRKSSRCNQRPLPTEFRYH